jgi:transposase
MAQFFSLEQVVQVEKSARVAATYTARLQNKQIGENSKKIAAEIGRAEDIDERTVRRWASQINRRRGNSLRKPGSGRPEKYNRDVIKQKIEVNDMYEQRASSRDIAEVLQDHFVQHSCELSSETTVLSNCR